MSTGRTLAVGGGSGTDSNIRAVVQAAHGLVKGMSIHLNGAVWEQADADDDTKSADAMVDSVTDAGNFVARLAGPLTATTAEWDARTGQTGGLTPGHYYWLSSTAGGVAATQPATTQQCLGVAESATVLIVRIGEVFGEAGGGGGGGSGGGISSGTSNPSSPATNALFFRTDLGLLIYYDGTRWLTVAEYSAELTTSYALEPITTNGYKRTAPLDQRQAGMWIVALICNTYVVTPNSGINYYTGQLRSYSSTNTPTNIGSSFSTAADAADQTISRIVTIGAAAPTTDVVMLVNFTKVLTPGDMYTYQKVIYRLIVT